MKQRKKITQLRGNGGTLRINLISGGLDRAMVELVITEKVDAGATTTSSLTVLAGDFTDAGLDALRFIVGAV